MGGGFRGKRVSYAAKRSPETKKAYIKDHGGRQLTDMPSATKKKVFISFHMDDENQVNLLRHQAENSEQLEFKDVSLREPFDEKWKTQCTEVIKGSDVVVVAIGKETYSRLAVLWEIERAKELGKPIVGMRIHSDENNKIPEPLERDGDKVVEWKLEKLQKEIDKKGEENCRETDT